MLAFYKGQITHDVNVCYKSGMMRKGQWFVKQTPIRPVIQNSSHIEHRILRFPVNPVFNHKIAHYVKEFKGEEL